MAGTPDAINSVRLTSNILAARRVDNVAPAIRLLQDEDGKKSLMTMSGEISTRQTDNPLFDFLTTEMLPNNGTTGASAASATASATATLNLGGTTSTVYLQVDDVIKFPSNGEICRVSASAASATAVDVVRAINGNATGTIASGAQWRKIGNAREENSRLYDSTSTLRSITTKEVSDSNYTQTFRTSLGLSRREMKSKLHGGPDRKLQRVLKMLEHCEEIENAGWHGVSASEGSNGRTYTGGIFSFIPSGNFEAITVLTEDEFDDFVRRITRYGSRAKRVLFCARYVGQLISGWAKSSQRITSTGSSVKYGVHVDTYKTGTGTTIDIVYADALEGIPGSTALGTWDGYACLVDPGNLEKVVFMGDDLKLATEVQFKDQDGVVDAYLSDVGFDPGHPTKHGVITGVTS